MDKNKAIIDNCPNFYKIINFDYFADDIFTDKLIKIYRMYIFSVNPLGCALFCTIRTAGFFK